MNAAAAKPAKILATCDRCEGKGYLDGMSHYAAGVCFLCAGAGKRKVAPYVQVMTPAMIAAAEKADAEEKVVRAFVEAHLHLSRAQVVAKFGALGSEKVYKLHGFVAGYVTAGETDAAPMLAALKTLLERFIVEDLRAA